MLTSGTVRTNIGTMNTLNKAKLVLIQLEALSEGNFEGRTIEQIGLINEVLRSAKELAEITLENQQVEEVKKAA